MSPPPHKRQQGPCIFAENQLTVLITALDTSHSLIDRIRLKAWVGHIVWDHSPIFRGFVPNIIRFQRPTRGYLFMKMRNGHLLKQLVGAAACVSQVRG